MDKTTELLEGQRAGEGAAPAITPTPLTGGKRGQEEGKGQRWGSDSASLGQAPPGKRGKPQLEQVRVLPAASGGGSFATCKWVPENSRRGGLTSGWRLGAGTQSQGPPQEGVPT